MKVITDINDSAVTAKLLEGGVGVVRTDTLYGILCMATNKAAVDRVYTLKGRDDHKSPIVLIAHQYQMFDRPTQREQSLLDSVWPGTVSVILPSSHAPQWIKRENNSVAYRLPDHQPLQRLLEATGPLIAPSANPQHKAPAASLTQAVQYFGETVDFYVDGGIVENTTPSRLLRILDDGEVERLR